MATHQLTGSVGHAAQRFAADQRAQGRALGRAGPRTVGVEHPREPRSAGRTLSDFSYKIQRLATRVLNSMAPAGARAESKHREGMLAFDKQIGKLIGASSRLPGRVDREHVSSLLDELMAMSMTLDSGATSGAYKEFLAKSMDRHLQEMPPGDNKSLKEGLQSLLRSPSMLREHRLVLEVLAERVGNTAPGTVGGFGNILPAPVLPDSTARTSHYA